MHNSYRGSCLGKLCPDRKMFFRKELLVFLTIGFLLFFGGLPMMAQSGNEGKHKVTGKITNESGNPVVGVTILEAGTKNEVTTDANGAFTMYVGKTDATLQISYIGYAPQSVKVNGLQALTIALEPAASVLNDIVVVGYGKQKKGEVTGAVANVKREDFTQGFAKDAGQLIQGKVAGLAVVSSSGDPNVSSMEDFMTNWDGSLPQKHNAVRI